MEKKEMALLILGGGLIGWGLSDLTKVIKERVVRKRETPFYNLIKEVSESLKNGDLKKAEESLEEAKKLIKTQKHNVVWEFANLTLTMKKGRE